MYDVCDADETCGKTIDIEIGLICRDQKWANDVQEALFKVLPLTISSELFESQIDEEESKLVFRCEFGNEKDC